MALPCHYLTLKVLYCPTSCNTSFYAEFSQEFTFPPPPRASGVRRISADVQSSTIVSAHHASLSRSRDVSRHPQWAANRRERARLTEKNCVLERRRGKNHGLRADRCARPLLRRKYSSALQPQQLRHVRRKMSHGHRASRRQAGGRRELYSSQ